MGYEEQMLKRSWMYNKNLENRSGYTREFYDGVKEFLRTAFSNASGSKIRCPCFKCANEKYKDGKTVTDHLFRKGFTPDYYYWICHGESIDYDELGVNSMPSSSHVNQNPSLSSGYEFLNLQQRMVFDVDGPNFIPYGSEEIQDSTIQETLSPFHNDDINMQWQVNEKSLNNIPSSSNMGNVQEDFNVDQDDSTKFWDVWEAANEPLWEGCESQTQLSSVSRLLNIKSEYNLSESCFDSMVKLFGECLPQPHKLPGSFYETKKLVKGLGLPVKMFDICPRGCMLYWKDDSDRDSCKFCKHPRYKNKGGSSLSPYKKLRYLPLIPRLQRLYSSRATAKHMSWHAERKAEEGTMSHPSDSEAWKHFDQTYPDFAADPRNVRLGLCADGFTPFGQSGKQYSCWPIIITPYNLPPSLCLTKPYMFLSMVVPGPNNPKKLIDVCLQPLIEELKLLWYHGVPTYDISRNRSFNMRAALLWTINDFPAYGMLAGWSTAGLMGCPICMEDTQSFWLKHSKKATWFDAHRRFLDKKNSHRKNKNAFYKGRVEKLGPPRRLNGYEIKQRVKWLPFVTEEPNSTIEGYGDNHKWTKQSVFWQLPYWESLLIRHNLDVMHIEKNVFENVFNTVMDIKGKSKDTLNARKDMKLYCNRPELEADENHIGPKPKAAYTLTKDQRRQICEWIKSLKFPDGYASNLGRCVQMDECKLIGMKSHDCHIFMQRLLPIALREMMPDFVWAPLTELSQLFQSLSSPSLSVGEMQALDKTVPLLLCKLEKIFPPSFFDSMEHRIIHLPYEAKIAGPVQYRWMYPFERFLYHLKKKVSNKAHVEASICSAYIYEEISFLTEHYFEPHVLSRMRRPQRNVVDDENHFQVSIFNYPGRGYGKSRNRWLTKDRKEMHAAETFILLNCIEIEAYVREFRNQFGQTNDMLDEYFTPWFKSCIENFDHALNPFIKDLAYGPESMVVSWPAYKINGFNFHTLRWGQGKSTMNSGVMVKGSDDNEGEMNYYGLIEEIIQLEYPGNPLKRVVLFKCRWFDPVEGTRVHKSYDLVEINHKKLYKKYDPFILAQQAVQVYYTDYPGAKGDRRNWWAVTRTKARNTVEERWENVQDAYQPSETVRVPTIIDDISPDTLLDSSGALVPTEGNEEEVDTSSDAEDETLVYEEDSDEY